MEKKTFQWVWDDKEQWNSPPPKFGSPYEPLHGGLKSIWIERPKDNQYEAERLYKEMHNKEKAESQPIFIVGPSWKDIDNWCKDVYKSYCKLWGVK